jgi:hypothetical protein
MHDDAARVDALRHEIAERLRKAERRLAVVDSALWGAGAALGLGYVILGACCMLP